MRQISERRALLHKSQFARILKMATEDPSIISLGPGEPDFDAPAFVKNAAKKSLDHGSSRYTSMTGTPKLREAIADKFKHDRHRHVDPNSEVIVTCGSNEALLLAFASVLDPGEELLMPDPCFLAYQPTIEMLNSYAVSIPLRDEENFQLTGDAIRESIKDPARVRAIVFSSPSNPTGTVFTKKSMEEIADIAVEYDFMIFADEAYEKFVYKGKYKSFAAMNGLEDRVVTFQSFSKTYAMPGFRVGYAVGPADIIESMSRFHTYTTLCAPHIGQVAGYHALKGPQGCVERMRKEYDRRRKMITKRINAIPGFSLVEPDGAFYAFPKTHFMDKGKPMGSVELCERLAKEAKVLAVPGAEFGRYGEGHIRLSYATAYPKIVEAMDRIEAFTRKLDV